MALIDKRIKVFHKENGGSSSARNLGLQYATGDFIGFIDSDDTIEKNSKVSDLIKWWDHLCNWGDIITKPKFSNFKESFLSFTAFKIFLENPNIRIVQ